MAGFHLNIYSPIERITRGMTSFSGSLRSVEEPFKIAIEDVIVPRVQMNIDEKTEAGTNNWEPLNRYTHQFPYRREYGPGAGALEVTGALYSAITVKERWKIVGQGINAAAHATYPSFLPYAAPHEYGFVSPITGGWVPARPYFIINEQDISDIETIFLDWMNGQFGKTVATGEVVGRDIDF
jgi:phage gpG-like protein